jgi:hypothetical protein
MYPHRIRLRGPWEYSDPTGTLPPGRLTMPAPLPYHVGPLRLVRRFGAPGQLDSDERVWLVVEGLTAPAQLTLNGNDLDGAEQDVTALLRPRNELVITLAVAPSQGPPWHEVCLEIRRTAYLRDVRVWTEGDVVHAAGMLAGWAEGPLDLYLVADRAVAAYTTLTARQGGEPFHLAGQAAGPGECVKVELVQGAVVWYAVENRAAQGPGA